MNLRTISNRFDYTAMRNNNKFIHHHHSLFRVFSSVIKNEQIKSDKVRLIYIDTVTKKSAWKIMDRNEAINYAEDMNMDLVLGNSHCIRS